MRSEDNPIEETTEEVRQGENVKGMTTVLGVSITAVIVLFAILLAAFFARTAGWF